MCLPEGPGTQHLRTLVPNTTVGMDLEPETLNIGYLDPLGLKLFLKVPTNVRVPGLAMSTNSEDRSQGFYADLAASLIVSS